VPPRVRSHLVLQLAAIAAGSAAVLLGAGLPLVAARAPLSVLALAVALHAAVLVALGAAILFRGVARPVERMLSAASQLSSGGLPALGPPGEAPGPSLPRVAIAFERTVAALADERARVAEKVAALERANRELGSVRESLVRSEKLATVGRLAGGVAHEVGNPLGAIAGYAELARARLSGGSAGAAEVADLLARISAEAARIDAIIRDLLDFARPSDLALAPVPLAGVVEGAVRLARVQPRFRSVEVALDLPGDLPPVRADERRLGQVLLNLLMNAGDAMEGSGAVRIAARAEGEHVRLEIADGGPGILPEHLPRLFDPFFTTKAPGKGTGLGLAVCHGIVESLGGEIAAENGPSGGAVFSLKLRAWSEAARGPPAGAVLR
jgi:two-component system, NtrC family, sensor kinase